MQTSLSGRAVFGVAVSAGVVKVFNPADTSYTAVTNNTGNTPALNVTGLIASTNLNQRMYFADGVNWVYLDPATPSLQTWTATYGSLPEDDDGNTPTIICTWRGRICAAGLLGDPQNIYMSAVGDGHDWDYAGQLIDDATETSITPTQAVVVQPGSFGIIGDVVTVLYSYTDDILLIGCDSSIRMLRGDPMEGGKIDIISTTVGMAFGTPICMGPDGTVYFFGSDMQIYSLVPGQTPRPISDGIFPELSTINTGENSINFVWDRAAQGMFVFVTEIAAAAAATHWFWDARTRAWFKVKFKNKNHNPLCCCVLDGNRPDDRVVIIGSWDGYVRFFDPDATDDDGEDIESEVLIGPFLSKDMDDVMISDPRAELSEDSEDVDYEVYAGRTAEEALSKYADEDYEEAGTWEAGSNPSSLIRTAAHAVYVRAKSSAFWAFERIRLSVEATGIVRRRQQ